MSSVIGRGGFGSVYAASPSTAQKVFESEDEREVEENNLKSLAEGFGCNQSETESPPCCAHFPRVVSSEKRSLTISPLGTPLRPVFLRKLNDQQVRDICKQLLEAVTCLHSGSVSHGDIKLENLILVQGSSAIENRLVLIDWGTGVTCNQGSASMHACRAATRGYTLHDEPDAFLGDRYAVLVTLRSLAKEVSLIDEGLTFAVDAAIAAESINEVCKPHHTQKRAQKGVLEQLKVAKEALSRHKDLYKKELTLLTTMLATLDVSGARFLRVQIIDTSWRALFTYFEAKEHPNIPVVPGLRYTFKDALSVPQKQVRKAERRKKQEESIKEWALAQEEDANWQSQPSSGFPFTWRSEV